MRIPTLQAPRILVLTALCALTLASCGRIAQRFTPDSPAATPERPNDSCDSVQYRRYVGQPTEALYDLVMVGPVRMIPAGSAVTLDHNPVRVNFDIDVNGVISGIWCG